MKRLSRAIFAFAVITASSYARETQPWLRLIAPGIELYTDNNENDARAALKILEEARSIRFDHLGDRHSVQSKTLRVFAFRSEAEYAPYRLNANASGHYIHEQRRDYIALEDIQPEHYCAAIHEYVHFAINQAGLHLPLWLNEGLADLYSSAKLNNAHDAFCSPLTGRWTTLQTRSWIAVDAMFDAARSSLVYNSQSTVGIFYAESWALTHMLALGPEYSPKFPEFISKLNEGVSAKEAIRTTFDRTPEQIESELRAYTPKLNESVPMLPRVVMAHSGTPELTRLSPLQTELALADLLAAHPSKSGEAERKLLDLYQENPDQPGIEELLGRLAWRSKRTDEARHYLGLALQHGCEDSDTTYRYALLEREAGVSTEKVIDLLKKAVELDPDNEEAQYNLGVLDFNAKRYDDAAEALLRVHNVEPSHSFDLYSLLAYCDWKSKHIERALSSARKANNAARDDFQRLQSSKMLRLLETTMQPAEFGRRTE